MKCPKCQNEMQKSTKSQGSWVCPNCKTRLRPVKPTKDSNSTWSNIRDSAAATIQSVGDSAIEKHNRSRELSKIGVVTIDKEYNRFQIEGILPKGSNKSSILGKTAKGVLALSTLGMSLAIDKAVSGSGKKKWFDFDQLIRYELIQDDSIVSSGGVGMALVGGVIFGGFGAIAGGITGKKKTKKKIESLILNVTVNDFDCPNIWVPFITSSTKIDSKKYQDSLHEAYTLMSTLDTIAHYNQQ